MSDETIQQENQEQEVNTNVTPVLPEGFEGYMDADDEMKPIAALIKNTTVHNAEIEPNRIKFLYSTKNPRKEGGRYVLGQLIKRTDMEKMVNDDYDYIITVYYDVWKDLDTENKKIQLDKVLCGIDMGSLEKPQIGKKAYDTREYNDNLRHYGATKVLDSSEMIDLACQRILEEKREKKKEEKKQQK